MQVTPSFNSAAEARPDLPAMQAVSPHLRQRLFVAAKKGDEETLNAIIKDRPDAIAWRMGGKFILQAAVEKKQAGAVRVLLAAGANPNWKNDGDLSAPLMESVRNDDVKIFNMLVVAGAGFSTAGGDDGHFMNAVRHNCPDMVKLLVEKGASPMALSDDANPALHVAVSGKWFKSAQALIEAGADINARNGETLTALMRAAQERNLPGGAFLTDRGADETLKSDLLETADDMAAAFAGDDKKFLAGWQGMAMTRRRRAMTAFLPALRNGLGEELAAPPRATFRRKL